jgi:hypothetical protein
MNPDETPQEKIGIKINGNGFYLIRENGDSIRLPFVQNVSVCDPDSAINKVIEVSLTFLPHFIDIVDSNGYQIITICEICGGLRSECKCSNKSQIVQSLIAGIRKDGVSPGYVTSWSFIYPEISEPSQNPADKLEMNYAKGETIKYTRHTGDNIPPDATIKGDK